VTDSSHLDIVETRRENASLSSRQKRPRKLEDSLRILKVKRGLRDPPVPSYPKEARDTAGEVPLRYITTDSVMAYRIVYRFIIAFIVSSLRYR